jgi:hypothetical protein
MNPYGQQSSQLGGYLMYEEDVTSSTSNGPNYARSHSSPSSPSSKVTRTHTPTPNPSSPSTKRDFQQHTAGANTWFDYQAQGKWWHAWYGKNGSIWGNRGANTGQTELRGQTGLPINKNKPLGKSGPVPGVHVTHIVSPVTHATPPGHNMQPLGLKQTVPSYKGKK